MYRGVHKAAVRCQSGFKRQRSAVVASDITALAVLTPAEVRTSSLSLSEDKLMGPRYRILPYHFRPGRDDIIIYDAEHINATLPMHTQVRFHVKSYSHVRFRDICHNVRNEQDDRVRLLRTLAVLVHRPKGCDRGLYAALSPTLYWTH